MRIARVTVALLVAAVAGCDRQRSVVPAEEHPPDARPAVDEFKSLIGRTLELHNQVEKSVPAPDATASASQITERRKAFAAALSKSRADAKHGEIFTPAVTEYFRQVVRSEIKGPEGKAARTAVKDGNPSTEGNTKAVTIAVNAPYPEGQPLSSVPPTLLLRLPRIPNEFDYRFVGRTLILRDIDANLILDYIPDILPN